MNAEFSRTLALLRQEKGVSQRTAADALGISQALMSHYEKGVREPGFAFLVRACDYYGVSADYLLGRTLTRDGTTIQADELYDVSREKNNVITGKATKGEIRASLHKKLMTNSLAMLYDLLGTSENEDLVQAASNYFATAISVVFRRLHGAAPKTNPSFFAVSQHRFLSGAYDVELKASEVELSDALVEHKKTHGEFVDMNHDTLTEGYGQLYQSLLQNVHNNGKRVNEIFAGREARKEKTRVDAEKKDRK